MAAPVSSALDLRRVPRIAAIAAVTLVALLLRLRAVEGLAIDFDEDDYLRAAQRYAGAIRDRDLGALVDERDNFEHPPLAKLVYGAALALLPPSEPIPSRSPYAPAAASLPEPHLRVARVTAALLGTLAVLAVAGADPLAGLFLAVHTWQVKYTSQVMLEPLPALTGALAVLLYRRSRRSPHPAYPVSSALLLGATAAAKYLHAVAGLPILADGLWRTFPRAPRPGPPGFLRRWIGPAAAWGALSLVAFVAFDPALWRDGFARLHQSLFYHRDTVGNAVVQAYGYPVWQPLVWLFTDVPWQPDVFPVRLDRLIGLLALVGLPRLWREERVLALWLAIALLVLIAWPARWPQYILILTVPWCFAAARGAATLGSLLRR